MKKSIVFFIIIAAVLSLKAQEPAQYTMKLDSVVGSDNFGWTRWKNVYTYTDSTSVAISYTWENQAWVPGTMTETFNETQKENVYRLTDEGWELYSIKTFWFLDDGDVHLIVSETTMTYQDTAWVGTSYSSYEYDEQNHLTLNMNYVGNAEGDWVENSKYEYSYNEAGLVDTVLYSTIRNGSWRESQKNYYSYNDEQQCTAFVIQTKGGWGPGANQWRDVYRYEFEYDNGELLAEYCYVAQGWFGGGDMALDSKQEYHFDANGNLLSKTASIFNEMDWVARDVYENRYDLTVEASKVQGLERFWKDNLGKGMGYTLGGEMPLNNLWLSCTITSSTLDTQFQLYCSGFAAVEENTEAAFNAYYNGENLVVVSEEPIDVTVFDMMGRQVAFRAQIQHCEFNLTPGLYLVRNGVQVTKVVVR